MHETLGRSIAYRVGPDFIAELLHFVDVSLLNVEVNRSNSGGVVQVLGRRGAAHLPIHDRWPVAAGDDDGVVAERQPDALQELRQLERGVALVLVVETADFLIQRKLAVDDVGRNAEVKGAVGFELA